LAVECGWEVVGSSACFAFPYGSETEEPCPAPAKCAYASGSPRKLVTRVAHFPGLPDHVHRQGHGPTA
jgi:hypothetical protein